jgi:hypothetical protein
MLFPRWKLNVEDEEETLAVQQSAELSYNGLTNAKMYCAE